MYILHLSDLHFGTTANAHNWYSQLADDLKIELNCNCIDAFVISGDVANKSNPKEYDAAKQFVKSLCREFNLNAEQLILVPGNHDLNWSLSKQAYRPIRRDEYKGHVNQKGEPDKNYVIDKGEFLEVQNERKYKKRFQRFSSFYEAIKGEPYPSDYEQQAILYCLPKQKLLFLGLNSAWQLDHFYTSRASIHPDALSNALTEIRQNSKTYEEYFKFAVWHHPLNSPFEDRITDIGFIERLCQNGFNVAFHGHIHKAEANLYRYDMSKGGRSLHIICAGTFGAPTHEWVPGYPLQYNLLKLENNLLTVETRCRREINGAWKPDAIWTQGAGKDPLPRYEIVFPEFMHTRYAKEPEDVPTLLVHEKALIEKLQDKREDIIQPIQSYKSMESGDKPGQSVEESSPVKKILIIAVNPPDTCRLRLDKEIREIGAVLRHTQKIRYIVEVRWAVRVRDLRQALLEFEPQIVHFCGHSGIRGIILEDDSGYSKYVDPSALSGIFALFQGQIECILFNSCYTQAQGNAIFPHVGSMVITKNVIQDKAAIEFSVGFYQALAHGRTIEVAYQFGCESIRMEMLPEDSMPVFIKNPNFSLHPYKMSYKEHQRLRSAARRILVVAVNPQDTVRLNLGEEMRTIYKVLGRARSCGQVVIEQLWAVRFGDLQQALLDFKPHIIHFAGHGNKNKGLLFEDERGNAQIIRTMQITRLFKIFSTQLECVLLNAVDTDMIALEISRHIGYAIGMHRLSDRDAIAFAAGFYRALGAHSSFDEAYELGCIEMQSQQDPCFKFTQKSLNNLRNEGIPEEILTDLQGLEEKKFMSEYEFLNMIERQIGKDRRDTYEDIFWKHVQQDDEEELLSVLYKKESKTHRE